MLKIDMNDPLVSAIVPVYNGERYIDSALKSIIEQNYHPLEIIVVDDGSTDNTAEIVRSFKEVHYIYQPNQGPGPAAARNTGILAAKGEFIAFLDADDIWMPNKLRVQANYLRFNPDVGFVVGYRRIFLEEGTEKPPWYKGDIFEKEHLSFVASGLLIRRSSFDHIGLYDPNYRYGENAEWLTRAKDAGIKYAILPEALFIQRIHGQNLTYNLKEMRSDIIKAFKVTADKQRKKGRSEQDEGKK
jgi:glycosyltransferase involved in cell wall biosynthesis